MKVKSRSHVQLLATPWTVAHQAPLFLGFSRQEHWNGLPFPSPPEWDGSSKGWGYTYGGGLVTKSYPTLAIPWSVARQVPLPMGFSRQEYWSGLPFPSPGDLLDPGIKPRSPALQADALLSEPPGKQNTYIHINT